MMINEPNDLIVKLQAAHRANPATDGRGAPDLHRGRGGRAALLGGSILVVLAFASAAVVTQMSGCCGGAPTHGCKFIETADAMLDSSSPDMMLPCGTQICEPGVTTCCLEAESEPPIRCIPLNQVCNGPSASCAGDQDCPFGAGQHCCGNLETFMVRCQAVCSGHYATDNTLRVCRVSTECPPDLPVCGLISVSGQSFFVCKAS